MKQKVMLIAGCSHTSGSEIDGTQDSEYNRQHSFGNLLAVKMGYTPINIAEPGSTNPTIARSVLQWFSEKFDHQNMEVYVLIAWTENTRMEVPFHRPSHYETACPNIDYFANTGKSFLRVNLGWAGFDPEEKVLIADYHRFMATNEKYLELVTVNAILQMQYFLQSKHVNYLMCNTMHTVTNNDHTKFYLDQIERNKYIDVDNLDEAFYWKYKNLGYTNPKAKYWHHDETPHMLYAEKLHQFIEVHKCS